MERINNSKLLLEIHFIYSAKDDFQKKGLTLAFYS
jgi:hypothetical protein